MPLRAVADATDAVEAMLRAQVPSARLVFLEPDVYRLERVA